MGELRKVLILSMMQGEHAFISLIEKGWIKPRNKDESLYKDNLSFLKTFIFKDGPVLYQIQSMRKSSSLEVPLGSGDKERLRTQLQSTIKMDG